MQFLEGGGVTVTWILQVTYKLQRVTLLNMAQWGGDFCSNAILLEENIFLEGGREEKHRFEAWIFPLLMPSPGLKTACNRDFLFDEDYVNDDADDYDNAMS